MIKLITLYNNDNSVKWHNMTRYNNWGTHFWMLFLQQVPWHDTKWLEPHDKTWPKCHMTQHDRQDMTWDNIMTWNNMTIDMTQHDMIQHDMTQRDMTQRDMPTWHETWHNMTWHDMPTWHDMNDMTQLNITRHSLTWHGMTWHSMTWHDTEWHDTTWHDTTQHYTAN